MKIIHWRRKWLHRGSPTIVSLLAEDQTGRRTEIATFKYEDGSRSHRPGWYAFAEWLRFPPNPERTLLAAFRRAGGRRLLEVAPPEVADYEDQTVLEGFPVAHKDIPK